MRTELTPTPIGSVTGAHLGDASLGRMSDWTVTVVSPSKTFALPPCRVAFATTTNSRLRAAQAHYRTSGYRRARADLDRAVDALTSDRLDHAHWRIERAGVPGCRSSTSSTG